jgi:uncharacterized protein DUF4331
MKLNTHIATLGAAILYTLTANVAVASSHREAPNVTRMPTVDSTDFYLFRSYEFNREDFVTIIANYIPLQDPQGGPNYFAMDPAAVYELHIDNNGDAVEDLTFQFKFTNSLVNNNEGITLDINGESVAIPLKAAGQIFAGNDANLGFRENYSINVIYGDRRDGESEEVTAINGASSVFTKPYDNVGNKTFPDYSAYASQYIHDINIPGCDIPAKVFVGQRKESFVVNLGATFDLVNYVPLVGSIEQNAANDDLRGKNITTIAMELPTSCIAGDSSIIGGWTTASLPQARILNPDASFSRPEVNGGALVQVSRLSNPLVNELVIGLKDKDKFNSSEPKNDGQFATYVTNPALPALLNILFLDTVNAAFKTEFTDLAPTNFPRADLVAAFLSGFAGVTANGSVAEMLRLNTALPITKAGQQANLGVAAGDVAGFPNGRRPGDDVVDIALRVVMGALCYSIPVDLDGDSVANDNLGLCKESDAVVGNQPFTDGAPISDADFDVTFPYLKTPLPGALTNN